MRERTASTADQLANIPKALPTVISRPVPWTVYVRKAMLEIRLMSILPSAFLWQSAQNVLLMKSTTAIREYVAAASPPVKSLGQFCPATRWDVLVLYPAPVLTA
ncbi:hypothetical protein Ddc_14171 [Ditylenchus destructor]|nr:hypothetical protein Ddc_14171 [Ditylenchus destructor]